MQYFNPSTLTWWTPKTKRGAFPRYAPIASPYYRSHGEATGPVFPPCPPRVLRPLHRVSAPLFPAFPPPLRLAERRFPGGGAPGSPREQRTPPHYHNPSSFLTLHRYLHTAPPLAHPPPASPSAARPSLSPASTLSICIAPPTVGGPGAPARHGGAGRAALRGAAPGLGAADGGERGRGAQRRGGGAAGRGRLLPAAGGHAGPPGPFSLLPDPVLLPVPLPEPVTDALPVPSRTAPSS